MGQLLAFRGAADEMLKQDDAQVSVIQHTEHIQMLTFSHSQRCVRAHTNVHKHARYLLPPATHTCAYTPRYEHQ